MYERQLDATLRAIRTGAPTEVPLHAFVYVERAPDSDEGGSSRVRLGKVAFSQGIWADVEDVEWQALLQVSDPLVTEAIPVTPAHAALQVYGPPVELEGAWPEGDWVEVWLEVNGPRRVHAVPWLDSDGALRGWSVQQVAAIVPTPWVIDVLDGRVPAPTPGEALKWFEQARRSGQERGLTRVLVPTGSVPWSGYMSFPAANSRLALEVGSILDDRPGDNVSWDPFGRWTAPVARSGGGLAARLVVALDAALGGDPVPGERLLSELPPGEAAALLSLAVSTGDELTAVVASLSDALRDPRRDVRSWCLRVAQVRSELEVASCAGAESEIPSFARQLAAGGLRSVARDLLEELRSRRALVADEAVLLARLLAADPGGALPALEILRPHVEAGDPGAVTTCRQVAFDTEAFEPSRCVGAPAAK